MQPEIIASPERIVGYIRPLSRVHVNLEEGK